MDNQSRQQSPYDMGLVSFRDVRLDRYQSLGGVGEAEYHLEIRVHGNQTKLFIVREGGLSDLVGGFLELVSLLLGEARINGPTEQACHALFHRLGSILAELLSTGRRNSRADCDILTQMGGREQSRVPEGDSPRASDASVSASVRTKGDRYISDYGQIWKPERDEKGGLSPDNS